MTYPKPVRAERGTKQAREYMELVSQLPCICCGRSPVELHHPIHGRFSQVRSSDLEVIPLCPDHHRALHSGPAAWRGQFGLDTDYIATTRTAVALLKTRQV